MGAGWSMGAITYYRIKDDPRRGWAFFGGNVSLVGLFLSTALFMSSQVVLEPRYQFSLAGMWVAFVAFAAFYRTAGHLDWVRNFGWLVTIALGVKVLIQAPVLPVLTDPATNEWHFVPYPWTHPGMIFLVLLRAMTAFLGLVPAFRPVPAVPAASSAGRTRMMVLGLPVLLISIYPLVALPFAIERHSRITEARDADEAILARGREQ